MVPRPRRESPAHVGVSAEDGDIAWEFLPSSRELYVAVNIRATKGICAELGIRCLFVLQPLLATRSPLTPFEQQVIQSIDSDQIQFGRSFYALAAGELKGESGFHDLSGFFDGRNEPVFFDFGHTSPLAGVHLGREIASRIIADRS